MAKSRRTCYFVNQVEFFDRDRPLTWYYSNKANKVMCHRIERAWKAVRVRKAIQEYYMD